MAGIRVREEAYTDPAISFEILQGQRIAADRQRSRPHECRTPATALHEPVITSHRAELDEVPGRVVFEALVERDKSDGVAGASGSSVGRGDCAGRVGL